MYRIREVPWEKFVVEFLKSRVIDAKINFYTSTAEELLPQLMTGGRCFLVERWFGHIRRGVAGGFAISGGELLALHVRHLHRGKGLPHKMVNHALAKGARRLNCFDGHLAQLYAGHGFVCTKRRKNHSPGGPDVLWMELL